MTVPIGDAIMNTNLAGLPAAAIAGRLAYVSDESPPGIFRDNGASWDRISSDSAGGGDQAYHIALQQAMIGSPGGLGWFDFNFSGGTANIVEDGRYVQRAPSGTAGIKGSGADAPVSTPYTVEMALVPHLVANNGMGCGIAMMESSTGQVFIELHFDSTNGWELRNGVSAGYTAAPTVSDTVILGYLPPLLFFRFSTTNNVNFTTSWSLDGRLWTIMPTVIDSTGTLSSVLNQAYYFRVPTASSPTGLVVGTTLVHMLNS